MARGDCNITNICIPTRRIIYSAGFTPPPPTPCNFPDGSFSQGGEICEWEYRVRYDVDGSLVPSDQSNFPVMVFFDQIATNLSPSNAATFWSRISRTDIRVTGIDGATELPHYTHALDTGTQSGYMTVLVPVVASGVPTSIFIYFDNPIATEYAVGNPLGRNATFTGAGYIAFWDMEQNPAAAAPQVTDLTGNGYNGTVSDEVISTGPSGTVTKVAGKVGSAYLFGNRRYIDCGTFTRGNSSYSIGGWFDIDNVGNRGLIGAGRQLGSVNRYALFKVGSGGTVQTTGPEGSGQQVTTTTVVNAAGWTSIAATYEIGASGHRIYANGANEGISGTINNYTGLEPRFLIAHYNNSAGVPVAANLDMEGQVSMAWFKLGVVDTAARIATEHANQNSPATFATFTNFLANT